MQVFVFDNRVRSMPRTVGAARSNVDLVARRVSMFARQRHCMAESTSKAVRAGLGQVRPQVDCLQEQTSSLLVSPDTAADRAPCPSVASV